jgi:hypothetical protein
MGPGLPSYSVPFAPPSSTCPYFPPYSHKQSSLRSTWSPQGQKWHCRAAQRRCGRTFLYRCRRLRFLRPPNVGERGGACRYISSKYSAWEAQVARNASNTADDLVRSRELRRRCLAGATRVLRPARRGCVLSNQRVECELWN